MRLRGLMVLTGLRGAKGAERADGEWAERN